MTAILIADDEISIRNAVSFYMQKEGYDVVAVKDGDEALRAWRQQHFDTVILDIMMPGHGGYEVCSAIRDEDPNVPVIFLSAKNDLIDKKLGFKLGADDYITKPFEPAELTLRVSSCLRRNRLDTHASSANAGHSSVISFGDLTIDPRNREVIARGKRIDLTTREYDVLAHLASAPNTVFTRQQILDAVWGVDYYGSAGVVAVFVRKLREKVEADPSSPVHLLTEWGVGYRLV